MATLREVLLVDDDPAIRETLTEILVDDGYRVATARNGEEALAHLRDHRRQPPGLILLDLMMPAMSGHEFLDAYARDATLPVVPVVVLSAHLAETARTHRKDILLYLTKPVDVPRLLETVDVWCG
jgi:CheY-like chemotaxis protein